MASADVVYFLFAWAIIYIAIVFYFKNKKIRAAIPRWSSDDMFYFITRFGPMGELQKRYYRGHGFTDDEVQIISQCMNFAYAEVVVGTLVSLFGAYGIAVILDHLGVLVH